ncbi:augmin complex subunit dgt6 [Scaptodrosophila lebanonensis]|uniref:Augmin complex subunit dgt6 n=1 Tax=Drosophila lebanonensis TaxID=7225 RepID=A0A6J2T3D0_DROLE|nr:augmin complex subunit dgt6 [Scaptodrosophila lebanonensis]
MDRTIIAPWKAEEKELSEKLHKKLQGLNLLHPMSEEMNKCVAWDMFIKPNQTAFFQVMPYLFRLLDPAEFRRRFYWPITDKKAEASFRSSTVDYLKHLNEKHNLQWANIKSYLVVMPGGMKFITFMLDLVGFVVQELIKQREKTLGSDANAFSFSDLSVKTMAGQSVFLKEYASAYVEELEKNTAMLQERIQRIRQIFSEISIEIGIDKVQLLDDCFIECFERSNRQLCDRKITNPTTHIAKQEEPLCTLKKDIELFLVRQTEHKHSQDAVDKVLCGMRKMFGTSQATDGGCSKMNALLNAFNNVSGTIAEQLDANNHYNDSNEYVTNELQTLHKELIQIETQLTDVQRGINARVKEHSSSSSSGITLNAPQMPGTPMKNVNNLATGVAEHSLMMKFISTPPIKLDFPNNARNSHLRLPLQDDFNAKPFDALGSSMLVPAPPRSARKLKAHEQSAELNSTLNRSKIVDPLQLLRTINKNTARARPVSQHNLSALGNKWKQLQSSFGFDAVEAPTSPQRSSAGTYSPFTPLGSMDRTRIERLPGTSDNNNYSSNSLLYAKKNAPVMKVLDSSLNVQNLSTSPSGRLEPLVPLPLATIEQLQQEENKALPHILLNDKSLNTSDDISNRKENDVNAPNVSPPKFSLDLSGYQEDDDLQNISDSVLNDISI